MINEEGAGRVYRVLFTAARWVDAERAHRWGMAAIRAAAGLPGAEAMIRRGCAVHDPALQVHALGLEFPSPLGLAAGFDKDALAVPALAALGFGFVEVGTVTALPQPGNPRPRLHRLPTDRAIVNRMGFNNTGSAAVAARLRRLRAHSGGTPVVVGVNVGKTKAAPAEETVSDYVDSTRRLAPFADYLVVNVSSPNTPGLRDLHAVGTLRPLLIAVRNAAAGAVKRPVPLMVKIAPDLADDDIVAIADLALELGLDGIVATNTTTSRDRLRSPAAEVTAAGPGGLSGEPLRDRSLAILRLLRARVGDRPALISVGGIASADDVWERLQAGATLVQAYTAFVYGGPMWPHRVNTGLARLLRTGAGAVSGAG